MNKKTLLSLVFFLVSAPFLVEAVTFDKDLFYGMKNSEEVSRLQEFLKNQGIYSGPVTGGFFAITKDAVKKFQEREKIVPAMGYFGPKTRARVGDIISKSFVSSPVAAGEDMTKFLQNKIKALQAEIDKLLSKPKDVGEKFAPSVPASASVATSTAIETSVPAITSASTSTAATTTPVQAKQLEISGTRKVPFPDIVTNPLKIGDISINNGTPQEILFSQIVVDVMDEMNSTLNRNRGVFLILRDGTALEDELISKNSFRFNSNPPQTDVPNRQQAKLSFPKIFKQGAKKDIGFWIESLEYVLGGKLEFKLNDLQNTSGVVPVGSFSFVFEK